MKQYLRFDKLIFRSLLLFIFTSLSLNSFGQSLIIGTGTTSTAGTGSDPIDGFYNELRYQVVYTAAELLGGGMAGGSTITALGWEVTEAYGAGSLPNYTIKIGHTAAVDASAHITAALTTVKNPFSFTPVVQTPGSFQMITFDVPFAWDGASNIVIDICAGTNPYIAPYGGVMATAMTNGARVYRCDGCGSQCAATTTSTLANRPNIKLDYTAGTACSGSPAPGVASGPAAICPNTSFSINVAGVTTGTGMVYEWKSSPAGMNTWSPVAGGNSPSLTVFGGQTAATDYHLVVTCTNGGASDSTNDVSVGVNSFLNCYCIPTNAGSAQITNITIGGTTFNNTSGTAPGPTYYNSFPPAGGATATLTQGVMYNVSATFDGVAISSIWIDFNQNGLFEATEWTQIGTTGTAHSATFTVPLTALPGQTGMRVRSRGQGNTNGATDACTAMGGGETEDYTITIDQAFPCAGTPAVPVASGPATACANAPFTLTTSGITTGLNLSYQWEVFNTNTMAWDPIPTATNPTYTVTAGQAALTDYRFVTTCGNGGASSISNVVSVGMSQFYDCYCSPLTGTTLHTTQLNYITDVTITGTTLSNASTTVGSGGYTQYSPNVTSNTASLDQGIQYTITVTHPFTGYFAGVWIDWDQSGTMDAGEFISMTTSGTISTGTFIVPYSSTPGLTGLRVRHGTSAVTSGQACTSQGYETEDYVVTIIQAVGCTGIPNTPTVTGPAGACPNMPFILAATGYTTGLGITFEWQEFNIGTSNWDPLPAPNGNPTYTVANQTATTDYRMVTTCSNGGGSSISNTLTVTQNAPTQCYCIPTYNTGGGGDIIANVELGVLNNNSSALGNPPTHYTDYTLQQPATIPIPDMAQGLTYNLMITFGTDPNQYYGVWFDFDQNGVFDTYEFFVGTPMPGGGNGTVVVPVTVPVTATLGNVRMRLRGGDDQAVTSAQACGFSTSTNYGEAEDYLVNILAAPSCVPPVSLSANPVTSGGATLNWMEAGTATQWSLEYGPQGFTPGTGTFVSINTTPGHTLTGLTPNTGYTFYVRAICSPNDSSLGAGPINFVTTQIPAVPPYAQNWETGGTDWTIVNGSQTNQFVIGTAASNTGSNSLYISNDNGTSNAYSIGTSSVVQAYRDVDLSAFTGAVPLEFNWIGVGESCCDYLRVWIVPTTFIPSPGIQTTAAVSGGTQLGGNMNMQATFVGAYLSIPASFAGTIARVVLEWRNDPSLGVQPPAAIDNLTIGGAPLAVKLEKISAVNFGARNRVDWNTQAEMEGDVFEVERSSDGQRFSYMGTVAANGEASAYSYWDETPIPGINYYRLKMVDGAGGVAYSDVVTAKADIKGAFAVEAYPNPVNDVLTVKVHGVAGSNATLSIMDVTGKLVSILTLTNNQAQVNMGGMAQGLYLIKYADDDRTQTIKVNKK